MCLLSPSLLYCEGAHRFPKQILRNEGSNQGGKGYFYQVYPCRERVEGELKRAAVERDKTILLDQGLGTIFILYIELVV